MKKILFALMMCYCGLNAQFENINYDSYWQGKLNFGQTALNVVLKIFATKEGKLAAHLDSPNQGVVNMQVTEIYISSDSLKFSVASIGASFKGAFEKEGKKITGIFSQSGYNLPLILEKTEGIAELRRPQNPERPFPYIEEEVTFLNPYDDIKLVGTLTLPSGKGKFPAIVLISGSGPQDRDETIFSHKPFLIIADYLTRNGIAALRYDDRGVNKSGGNFYTATTEDFMKDAVAAVEYLKTRNEIDHEKIGLVGHSEGGLIAPMVAASSDDVKFLVLLAPPGIPGKDLIPLQTELIMKTQGIDSLTISRTVSEMKIVFEIITNNSDSLVVYNKLKELYQKEIEALPEEVKKKPEYSFDEFDRKAKNYLSPWFRFFLKYDPAWALENVKIPILALWGSKDLQVPARENMTALIKALEAAGNKQFKTVVCDDLNHLFQKSITGLPLEYGSIEETIYMPALEMIKDWIKKTVNQSAGLK
ncbi:alpha/beta hydrolase family protein [Melioribacter sp. OK-6-Me]|uniref:alpha/beta hydrolase family protein n=1 Tax=unclassified Melioribacter TaxID=2627329 RepID=UPI003EDA4290